MTAAARCRPGRLRLEVETVDLSVFKMSLPPAPPAPSPYVPLVVLAVVTAVAATALLMSSRFMDGYFLDNDDLLRMKQVRDLIGGKPWFDLHEPRIDPPYGMDGHWSRLVDGGIALLVLMFLPFTDMAAAERLGQIVWPLLWIAPTVLAIGAAARRLAGPLGGGLAALHAALSFIPGFTQFRPGRIDHHNLQNFFALLMFATALGLDGSRASGRRMGLAVVLLFAVGLESAPFAVLGLGFAAYRFVRGGAADEFRGLCETILIALPAVFLVQTPPHLWLRAYCDALGFNMVAGLAGASALGLAALAGGAGSSAGRRYAVACGMAAVATALLFGMEPRCLAGPFGAENQDIYPLWLSRNTEVQRVEFSLRGDEFFLLTIAPVVVGLSFLAFMARAREMRERVAVSTAFLLVAAAMALGMTRNLPYAALFGSTIAGAGIAALVPALRGAGQARASILACLFIVTIPLASSFIIENVAAGAGAEQAETAADKGAPATACDRPEAFAELAALPPGRVLASLTTGTPILALTPHAVFAAPYHRSSNAIVENIRLMDASDAEVRAFAASRDVTYVAACRGHGFRLERRLVDGPLPDWLIEVPTTGPLAIWRVRL